MQIKTQTSIFALALVLFLGTAEAQRSAGETVDDSTLASSTKLALISDSEVPGGNINVETYKGVEVFYLAKNGVYEASVGSKKRKSGDLDRLRKWIERQKK